MRSATAAGCHVIVIPHIVDVPHGRGHRVVDSLTDLRVDNLIDAARGARCAVRRRGPALLAGAVAAGGGRHRCCGDAQRPGTSPTRRHPDRCLGAVLRAARRPGDPRDAGRLCARSRRSGTPRTGATTITSTSTSRQNRPLEFVSATRAAGARSCRRSSMPCPPVGWPRCWRIPLRAPPMSAPSPISQPTTASTASTSTTRSLRLPTTGPPGRRHARCGSSFVSELGRSLHADGRTLSVSVPHISDGERTDVSGYWVYDYAAMSSHVDQIRIMAYDYSTDKPGPIAPLSFVRQAISAAKKAVDDDSKLVLGVALYGHNWPIATVGTCPADQEGNDRVSQRNIDELLAKRSATPVARPGDRRIVVHLSARSHRWHDELHADPRGALRRRCRRPRAHRSCPHASGSALSRCGHSVSTARRRGRTSPSSPALHAAAHRPR